MMIAFTTKDLTELMDGLSLLTAMMTGSTTLLRSLLVMVSVARDAPMLTSLRLTGLILPDSVDPKAMAWLTG